MVDWVTANLGEVCFTTSGGTPSRGNKSFYGGNIPWVKSGELNNNLITETSEYITEEAILKSSAKIFPKGTILFALYGATIGKMAVLGIDASSNQAVCGIYENRELIHPKYLYNYLLYQKRNLIEQGIGGAQPNISQTILKKLPIPIAPLPIQRAIVAKIEELFSSVDSGVADIKKAQEQIKVYRQAVLKKALEVKSDSSSKNLDLIPKGWAQKEIKKVCENIKVGIVIKPTQFYSSNGKGIPAFRSANVREFRVNDSNWVYFTEEGNEQNHRTKLKKGDVLLVRSGYPGTSCIVPAEFEGSNAIDILIATPDKNQILPEYLCAFNNSPMGKGLFSEGSRGVAQKHLNVGVYSKMKISYPIDIAEQRLLIKEVEKQLSISNQMQKDIKIALEQTNVLKQSILKKAFEGNLLSNKEIEKCKQEHDYEPADILLKRIKNEKG